MKLYRTKKGILIENEGAYYAPKEPSWDKFLNDDDLFDKMQACIRDSPPDPEGAEKIKDFLLPPVENQEIWASGVTYFKSKLGRQEESKDSGGGTFYEMVYNAERPELFMKATGSRARGHGDKVRIRKDSTWDVPEPELTLVMSSSGKIIGYTIGNDMSSRSIEGENPLYLPQAKIYDGSAAVGPCIYVTDQPLPSGTTIHLEISRNGSTVFSERIAISQIKREFTQLAGFLYREYTFPHGSLLMTGTGIVPDSTFTLQSGDKIKISIDGIGTLVNTVE
ncbi:fumarylacetoacetate hydrolase family protein [Negadavirga shengliensis]|uniref:Fumarylacetoacetate hydrolase family protein n=1 Tax=Negadavirga shengliensis TaxID=1389218 RepID=A0ABV9SZV6_9BACT